MGHLNEAKAEAVANPIRGCADCGSRSCVWAGDDQYPKFCLTNQVDDALVEGAVQAYFENQEYGEISRVSACIEGEYYCKLTRVEETIEFIERRGYQKVGIASCVGLLDEARIFVKILRARGIDAFVAGCKLGAVDKTEIGIPEDKKLNGGTGHESLCNPVLQARVLAQYGSEFNVVIGLCVGHDSLFLAESKAPATVMIVKDRVLGHNPVQALYTAKSGYSRFKDELKTGSR